MEPTNDLNSEAIRWRIPIDEDGILTLPDELLQSLGWQEGDELEWIDQEDGSFVLQKLNQDEQL